MLVVNTLFETIDKVKDAIDRLREFEPPEGYYLAFSGGKDSVVLYALAELAGVKFDAHMSMTTVDPPEVVSFVRNKYPNVKRHYPDTNFWELMKQEKFPPTMVMRYCCKFLKESGGENRIVLTGVRWEESTKRAGRKMVEFCSKSGSAKRYVHPIIDWSSDDVWEFIKTRNIDYCSLYDEGFDRVGCVMCPAGGHKRIERDAARWPKFEKKFIETLDEIIDIRAESDLNCTFESGEEFFDFWKGIAKRKKGNPDQAIMFE